MKTYATPTIVSSDVVATTHTGKPLTHEVGIQFRPGAGSVGFAL